MQNEPYLIVEWNDTETEAKGWLCVYNFVNHYAGGGTRMHPTVTKEEVVRLAKTMAYKYKACESITTGGCKGGIAYDYKAPDAKDVLRRYLIAMSPYLKAGVSLGGDLGVDYGEVLRFFDETGIGLPQTKEMRDNPRIQQGIQDHDDMVSMKYDDFLMYDMVTGYGIGYSADEAWKFKGGHSGARVVVQGFGCAGASCALLMTKLGYKVVGIADANGMVVCERGLDVKKLIDTKLPKGEMNPDYFDSDYRIIPNTEWLDVDCDILIPVALEDVINASNAHRVRAQLVVEGANIPVSVEGERILAKREVDIVTDFVANLGAIRFYDVIIFGLVEKSPQAVVDDIEQLCRRNTRKIFELAKLRGLTQREVAFDIFAPDQSDHPDF
ncbi:glutamate dehydrogenase (NAD(P)+) [Paenibacillaceae bacterium GAS479]|nr:glutamate dehydrogenase (NAD(P)+) [Paenibacillaceae bacterium GAS479]